MEWKTFFLKFFRNILLGILLSAVALGMLGFLFAGKEGAINGIYWGAVLGLIGGCFSSFVILVRYWGNGENIQMFPEYQWFVKKTDDTKYDH